MRSLHFALFLGLAAAGCASSQTTSPRLTIGPYSARDPNVYRLLRATSTQLGYRPRVDEPARGRFVVDAHSAVATFVVQVYREGWVTVSPEGGLGFPTPDGRYTMDRLLRGEYWRYVTDLEAVGPPR